MHQDFKDLLSEFNAHGVEYLVVGAHALAAHGHVRATKDMDVWVRPTPDNAQRVMNALAAFGAPVHRNQGRSGTVRQGRSSIIDLFPAGSIVRVP
jgi:hypothetical protein